MLSTRVIDSQLLDAIYHDKREDLEREDPANSLLELSRTRAQR